MITVIPAILEKDPEEIKHKLQKVDGLVEWVQIDIADNTLVPNTTVSDPILFAPFTSKLNLEVHLMVRDPLLYADKFIKAGFKRLFAHVEGDHVVEFMDLCEEQNVEAGLAIDGPTPLDKIKPYLEDVDAVLVMAIEAGFSGRPFREDTVEKIKALKNIVFDLPIAVDGAMNLENAKKVVAAGADRICTNSYLFNAPDIKSAIESLKALEPQIREEIVA